MCLSKEKMKDERSLNANKASSQQWLLRKFTWGMKKCVRFLAKLSRSDGIVCHVRHALTFFLPFSSLQDKNASIWERKKGFYRIHNVVIHGKFMEMCISNMPPPSNRCWCRSTRNSNRSNWARKRIEEQREEEKKKPNHRKKICFIFIYFMYYSVMLCVRPSARC